MTPDFPICLLSHFVTVVNTVSGLSIRCRITAISIKDAGFSLRDLISCFSWLRNSSLRSSDILAFSGKTLIKSLKNQGLFQLYICNRSLLPPAETP